jgi:hypothetical protein
MTEYRRGLRLHQARWREAHGHPIGFQPIVPRPDRPARPAGARLPLHYAQETGANFVTQRARDAARARTSFVEPHQSFDHQRLWADLLWSPSAALNLFGDLAADLRLADRAVHAWWPGAPGTVREVRFEHSPGRFEPAYLNSLRAFDTAFLLDLPDGTSGVLAVDVKYHERLKAEIPKPTNLERYLEVAKRSRVFRRGAVDSVKGRSELAVTWLEHLLLLSMLQHPSAEWSWGVYVVVHPEGNSDMAEGCRRYAELLADRATFQSVTFEALLEAGCLPKPTTATLRSRYLPV